MPLVDAEHFASTALDYLIIGGGTAGLVLAARLSEDPNVVVGVIEAGGSDTHVPQIDVPAMMGSLIMNPTYDWAFFSAPQKNSNNRSILQPRGKGLGGSSLINFLGMFRPSRDELNAIEELGNPEWNWPSFLRYMKKSETTVMNLPEDGQKFAVTPNPDAHGTDGPIVKSLPSIWPESHERVLDTAEALGVPKNGETSNGLPTGAMTSWISVNPRNATRSHAANAYFEPNAGRANLLVLTNAQVTKVLFNEENNGGPHTAIGAEYIVNERIASVTGVKQEVILSAGTFQTPQLLELSGIGNSDILNKHNIKVLVDLPGVGENLQDHIAVTTIVEIDSELESLEVLSEPEGLKKHQELYAKQTGLLSTVPAPCFVFVPAKGLGNDADVERWKSQADVEMTESIAASVIPSVKEGLQKQYNIQKKWFDDPDHPQVEILHIMAHRPVPESQPVPGKRYATLLAALMHPTSRGSVHISSLDPLAPPTIDPNYFGNKTDLELLIRATEFALSFYSTAPLSDIVKTHVLPSPEIVNSKGEDRREKLTEYVKDTCSPTFHPLGTASMLPRADGGVVDFELKVYGTINLRVVDLSVIPMELACHTQSTAYALAEKAADLFKECRR